MSPRSSKRQKTSNNQNNHETTNGDMGSVQAWNDLPQALGGAVDSVNKAAAQDGQLSAFVNSDGITEPVTFGIKSAGSPSAVLVTVSNGKCELASAKDDKAALFTLSALPEQWSEFFKLTPEMPYQSYWGMFGMNIKQKGIEVTGDQRAFANWTHVWRRVLELLHDSLVGPTPPDEEPEYDEDCIVGRYTYVTSPLWKRCKVFYEQSGEGQQEILFLHTAGSDSRQYHGVMNHPETRKKLKMTAVDLPAHGRSFPYEGFHPGNHTNTEEGYVGFIAAFIKKIGMNRPIVCGASMAGQVCLAVAIHNKEVGAKGTIPLQGSDYLNMERQWSDQSPYVNSALFNPEWVYGMQSPTASEKNKQLIWHLYSAQVYGCFHGDLDFYFGGWDGRSRMKDIDTKECPVYMLTGSYDWSNTPEMAQKTADKIPGGKHEAMEGLGHFPATESPSRFVPYLLRAVDYIVANGK